MPNTDQSDHPASRRRPLVQPVCQHLDQGATDDLLVAAGRGDLGAFATFYDHTVAVVFGMLRAVLADPVGAERATERIYVHLWRNATRFDPAGKSAYSLLLFTTRRELTGRLHNLVIPHLTDTPRPRSAGA